MQKIRASSVFASEKQRVPAFKICLPERFLRLCGKEPNFVDGGGEGGFFKCAPIWVVDDVEAVPIVHAAALQLSVGDFKSQRVDQMQPGSDYGACAPDIPDILRYFRLEQDNV